MEKKRLSFISHVHTRFCTLLFALFLIGGQLSLALPGANGETDKVLQDVKVSGTVYDEERQPVVGANITVKGTTSGTITDFDGKFSIEVAEGSTIVISFIGYANQEITISEGMTELEVILLPDTKNLQEVVVVGYGEQTKETITGSLSTVSSEEILEQPVSNVTHALAGRLPGLIANDVGGRPGNDAATIKIRGISTLDAGAGSNPLILIDGIERDQSALSYLDPNEIENLSILKDASATAVFGVRGANGVILVTTKRGKTGPVQMKYKGSMAVMVPDRSIKVLNSYQQTGLLNEYSGFEMNSTDPNAPYPQNVRDRYRGVIEGNPINPSDPFFYPSTNYAELMLKDYTLQQQHNFTVSGGTEKIRYFLSLGYFNQGGLFDNVNPYSDKSTTYKRYNYRTNIDVSLTKTTSAKINIGGSFNETTSLGQGGTEPARSFYWNLLVHSAPWDGYVYDDKLVMLQENANSVLLNSDMRGYNVEMLNNNDYTFIVDQKLDFITKGLSLKGTVSFVNKYRNYISRAKDTKRLPYWTPSLNSDGTVSFYQAKEDVIPFNSTGQDKSRKEYYEFALNYNRTFFDDHSVTALALFNAEKSHFSQSMFNAIPRAYMGLVGRVTYDFRKRYLLEFNLGYNGSENFAEGKRFGFFPAYSAGWTFTEEPWLKSLIGENILTYGKFRFSYGTVGNDKMRIGGTDIRFLYLPDSYSLGIGSYHGWHDIGVNFGQPGSRVNNRIAVPGIAGNPNVTWEKSTKINYGVDLHFLNDIVSLKFDYFTEDRVDILVNQGVVPIYQQTGLLALNLGQVHNEGFEIELGLSKKFNNTRIWMDLNYSHYRNEIIEMDEPNDPLEYRMATGKKVGELWGYKQDGYFNTEGEANAYRDELWATYSSLNPGESKDDYQAYKIFGAGSDVSAGDLKVIDRNGDGLISDLDEGYLGTPSFPETMFGVKLGVTHKKLSLSVLFQGGSDFAINIRTNYSPDPSKGSLLDFVMNRYTPERYEAGEKIEFPRLLATNDNWKAQGTFWLRDATYLRLKNVELAYTFDASDGFIKAAGLESIRLFASGMNLLTFSQIKYMDPETTNGELRYPRSRVINLGVQVQF